MFIVMREMFDFIEINVNCEVSDFFRLFMMFFKYGLILSGYSSTDSVKFLSLLPS